MSYYTRLYDFLAGATVRSQEFDDEFNAIQSGFSAVETRLQAAIQTPENTTQTLPAAASRINKILSFDASGNVSVTNDFTGSFSFSGSLSVGGAVACADPAAGNHAATKQWVQTLALSATIPVTPSDAGKVMTNNGSVIRWEQVLPTFGASDALRLLGVNADGTALALQTAPLRNISIYTTSGMLVPDANNLSNKYFVIAIGGGGGGYDVPGYSGWGGETVMGIMTISSAQTVTIGAGGIGGASPTAGGDTAIGTLLVAKGGPNAYTPSPATGGTTPSGCVRVPGGRSVGSSTGCTGGTWLHVPTDTNYDITTLPQDGHGGGSTASSYTQRNGGAGIVIIIW